MNYEHIGIDWYVATNWTWHGYTWLNTVGQYKIVIQATPQMTVDKEAYMHVVYWESPCLSKCNPLLCIFYSY